MPIRTPRLTGATLRANPDLRFVPARALRGAGWTEAVAPGAAPEFAGALHPGRQRWIGVRAIDHTAAALFKSVRRPGRLPAKYLDYLGTNASHSLAVLILDGVLEIEQNGRFISGADAHAAVIAANTKPRRSRGVNARLSLEALHYAASLPLHDVDRLALRMYSHNRAPATPALRRRFPRQLAAEQFLGFTHSDALRALIDRGWRGGKGTGMIDSWRFWSPIAERPPRSRSGGTFKIFVSPLPMAMPDATRIVVETLLVNGTPPFKVGAGLYGLLRPDKIVVYFGDKARMLECGRRLCRALAGIPAQGVPFSAEIGGEGLVSWGVDPAPESLPLANRGSESWRIWVTSRLARSLVIARHAETEGAADAVTFAVDRLTLGGIDPATWAPTGN